MSNLNESPTSETSGNVEPTPTRGTYHLGRTLAVLTFVEIFLAMLLAPADNGRWLGYATAAIVLANGLVYLTQYVPCCLRHGCDPGTTTAAIVAYTAIAFACVVGMTFILDSGLLP